MTGMGSDGNVGCRLLKQQGASIIVQDQNTCVVYLADHGYMLGHHGRIEKHCCYDQALRVPLIMRWPGRIMKGASTAKGS